MGEAAYAADTETDLTFSTRPVYQEANQLEEQETIAPYDDVATAPFLLPQGSAGNGLSLKLERGILLSNTESEDLSSEPFPFELRTNAWPQLRHAYFYYAGHQ